MCVSIIPNLQDCQKNWQTFHPFGLKIEVSTIVNKRNRFEKATVQISDPRNENRIKVQKSTKSCKEMGKQ